MNQPSLFVVAALAFTVAACSSSSSESNGADAATDGNVSDATGDAISDASTGCRGTDQCCLAMSAPGEGDTCSPTQPCNPNLDCIYAPGCAAPQGQCRPWARCPDSAIFESTCNCDGTANKGRTVPWTTDTTVCPDGGGDR